ncbi:MAG: DUF1273 family protein [Clostridia bacterium]|nr:DUF1273 family protein [Clostridia bacterium]
MKENTCCFIGHRDINETAELRVRLLEIIEKLIVEKKVDTFLFGSRSRFDSLCLELVTELKAKYPHVSRVYVRAEYPFVDDRYVAYLLTMYDDTYFPEKIIGAGRAAYVERNREMIDRSSYCVAYYDAEHASRKSGTKMALGYALKRGRDVIRL